MMRRYNDAEQFGAATVPDVKNAEKNRQRRREMMEETVWSHRLTAEER